MAKEARYWGPVEEAASIVEHLDGMASELEPHLLEVDFAEGKITVRSPDPRQLILGLAALQEETLLEPRLPRSGNRIS